MDQKELDKNKLSVNKKKLANALSGVDEEEEEGVDQSPGNNPPKKFFKDNIA